MKHFSSVALSRILLLYTGIYVVLVSTAIAQQRVLPYQYQAPLSRPDSFPNKYFVNSLTPSGSRKRAILYTGLGGGAAIGSFLGVAWYGQDSLVAFHFFDDSHEWKQMDKAGHVMSAYTATRWTTDMCKWAGMPKKKSLLVGALVGFGAMSSVEVFDGFGAEWGASWSDIGANFLGTSLAVANEALWNEQRVQLKFSYVPSNFVTNKDSLAKYSRIFGSNPAEWVLKDYNGLTIWLSCRVHSFLPEGRFKEIYPQWLNVAVGYGADGMTSGFAKTAYRQGYFSFDVDLGNIKTRNGPLRTLLNVSAMLRLPLPAVQFDKNGVAFKPLQ